MIRVSVDAHSHRGWSMDYQGLPPSDVYMMCEPDIAVPMLLDAVRARPAAVKPAPESQKTTDSAVSIRALAQVFNEQDVIEPFDFSHGQSGAACRSGYPAPA